jgi:hypothetical protein
VSLSKTIVFGTPCKQTISAKNEISNMRCIIAPVTWYKISHFREMIVSHKILSLPLFVLCNPKIKPIELSSKDTIEIGRGM